MNRLRRFFATMVGRLFLILLVGMTSAAMIATVLAEAKRHEEFRHQDLVRAADRLLGYVKLLDSSNPGLRAKLLDLGGPGVRRAPPDATGRHADPEFAAVLAAQSNRPLHARVVTAQRRYCRHRLPAFVPPPPGPFPHDDAHMIPPTCRLIGLRLNDGTPLTLALETPPMERHTELAVDPVFLSLLVAAIALLAYLVARIASQPLRELANAADELGRDLQREPLAPKGPLEVRRAAQAFNAMQKRIQRHLAERTQMLAAITHDLRTPLTRMRLRLENVPDEVLRERLVDDLTAMNALIREGLDLARSATTAEQPLALDLDSLLESIVEDAAETGGEAVFEQGCQAVLMLRPLAMHRLFSNLVDNALKYGRTAHVSAQASQGIVTVRVRDHGPGISEDKLEAVFDPFMRLETSRSRETGGVGLGLTIARALAEKDGATLMLRNAPRGGLEAIVQWADPPFASTAPSH